MISHRIDPSVRENWTRCSHEETRAPSWRNALPEGWGQGRSVFGGLVAAYAASLHYAARGEARSIRTISAQFLRPTSPGEIFGESVQLREGKHVTFSRVTLTQNEAPVYIADLIATHPRQTELAVPNARPRPECTPPGELEDLPYIEGLTPEFTQHVRMRWAQGGYPYSGAKRAYTIAHCRYREVVASGLEGLLGLLDALPAPSLSVLEEFAAASTVSWTAHLIKVPEEFEQWFTFTYETLYGAEGFHTVVGSFYDERGELLAWTNQLAAVYG